MHLNLIGHPPSLPPSISENRPICPNRSEGLRSFFPFQSLLSELQKIITDTFLDMPTRYAFSMTCTKFRRDCRVPFDRLQFADKCAEEGYLRLLEWSFNCGGPFDAKTAEVAARHGHVDILAMYLRKKHQLYVTLKPLSVAKEKQGALAEVVQQWGCVAAWAGNKRTLDWLITETGLWEKVFERNGRIVAIQHAAQGGHVALALHLLRLSHLSMRELWADNISLLSTEAARGGHLEAVQHFLNLEEEEDFTDRSFLVDCIAAVAISNPHSAVLSWCTVQNPYPTTLPVNLKVVAVEEQSKMREFLASYFNQMRDLYLNDRPIFTQVLQTVPFNFLPMFLEALNIEKFQDVTLRACDRSWRHLPSSWLKEHGIVIAFPRVLVDIPLNVSFTTLDREWIKWVIDQGVKATFDDIEYAVGSCPIDILEMLWGAKRDDLNPDGSTIPLHIALTLIYCLLPDDANEARFSLVSFLRSIAWLKGKKYTYGPNSIDTDLNVHHADIACLKRYLGEKGNEDLDAITPEQLQSVYDRLILTLLKKYPRFCRDYCAEIEALELPLLPQVSLALSRLGQSDNRKL